MHFKSLSIVGLLFIVTIGLSEASHHHKQSHSHKEETSSVTSHDAASASVSNSTVESECGVTKCRRCCHHGEVVPGWSCGKNRHGKSECSSVCGDGLRVVGEDCDNGNAGDGDGCSSKCTVEEGWYCSGGSPTGPDTCEKTTGLFIAIPGVVAVFGLLGCVLLYYKRQPDPNARQPHVNIYAMEQRNK